MAGTCKIHVSMVEQLRLINECRQSGMTDADWCRENDIEVSTFYNWVSRCRKAAADQIQAPNYGHPPNPWPKQNVVSINIVPDHLWNRIPHRSMQQTYLDNSHTIEVTMKDVFIRISKCRPCLNITVRRSRQSELTEPPVFCYLACAGSKPYTSLIERSLVDQCFQYRFCMNRRIMIHDGICKGAFTVTDFMSKEFQNKSIEVGNNRITSVVSQPSK